MGRFPKNIDLFEDYKIEDQTKLNDKSNVLSFDIFSINEEDKWAQEAKPKEGKMHKILGIDPDKKITDVYTSGKELAKDLLSKVDKKEASGMLAFAANIDKEHNIFDVALSSLDEE